MMYDLILFFFNDTATTEIYTLSLHDALPIWIVQPLKDGLDLEIAIARGADKLVGDGKTEHAASKLMPGIDGRSEEHTSELQSQSNLVCRLLLEKKKKDSTSRYRSPSDKPMIT